MLYNQLSTNEQVLREVVHIYTKYCWFVTIKPVANDTTKYNV